MLSIFIKKSAYKICQKLQIYIVSLFVRFWNNFIYFRIDRGLARIVLDNRTGGVGLADVGLPLDLFTDKVPKEKANGF